MIRDADKRRYNVRKCDVADSLDDEDEADEGGGDEAK